MKLKTEKRKEIDKTRILQELAVAIIHLVKCLQKDPSSVYSTDKSFPLKEARRGDITYNPNTGEADRHLLIVLFACLLVSPSVKNKWPLRALLFYSQRGPGWQMRQ